MFRMNSLPQVKALEWADIRSIMPNETLNFTPWLSANLELLADAIGLEELEVVATEAPVGELRLDIRATGQDTGGNQYAVAIENQYGASDHDHLGKLVTYAAHAYDDPETDRVLGVWITEQVREPHLAAIEFLNRTSPDDLGYVLVTPRFVRGPDDTYFVHFEVHAEPNLFLRTGKPARTAVPERAAFMSEVFERVDPAARALGYRHTWSHPEGRLIRLYPPLSHPLSDWLEVRALVGKDRFRVLVWIAHGDATRDESLQVLDTLRQHHEDAIAEAAGTTIDWDSPGATSSARNAWARIEYSGLGYEGGSAQAAAERTERIMGAVLVATSSDDPDWYPAPAKVDAPSADTATVIQVMELIEHGEWTTYGDISRTITGSTGSAMSIGNIIASNPNVPNPHRVLKTGGQIPPEWTSSEGLGPEECVRLLEAENVQVINGKAVATNFIGADVLRTRWKQQLSG